VTPVIFVLAGVNGAGNDPVFWAKQQMPRLTELRLFDNSEERDAESGKIPPPRLLLHWQRGAIVAPSVSVLESTPEWAKPIVAGALKLRRSRIG